VGAVTGLLTYRAIAQEPPVAEKSAPAPNKGNAPIPEDKNMEKLTELLKALREAAQIEFDVRHQEFLAGRGTLDFELAAARRLLAAELELSDKKEERLKAYEDYLERMREFENVNQGRFQAGKISIADLKRAEYERLEAEIWLERAKAK
jgi:outer membrane protein TolC